MGTAAEKPWRKSVLRRTVRSIKYRRFSFKVRVPSPDCRGPRTFQLTRASRTTKATEAKLEKSKKRKQPSPKERTKRRERRNHSNVAVPNFATASRPISPSSADPASTPNLASSASTPSLKENVLCQLTALKDVAHSIFNAINDVANDKTPNSKITTSKHPLAPVKKAVQIDAALQRAVDQIDAHQKYQSQIFAVQLLIAEEDAAILNIIQQLQVAKAELENVIHKAKKEPTIRDLTNREPLEFDTIIKVAKNLAKYTSAPPTFNPAVNDPLIVVEPPYPSELEMRAGLINQPNLGLTTSSLSQEDAPNVTEADPQHANIHRPPTMQYQEDDETTHPLFDLDLNPDLE